MPEINLPTKSTQDAIKTTTDTIKTTADTIKTNTDGVKAKTDLIGVANPATAGTDTVMNYLKKLDSSKQLITVTGQTEQANAYKLLMEINGTGILKHLSMLAGSNTVTEKITFLKVTIDGVVIFETCLNGNGESTGLINKDNILINSNSSVSSGLHFLSVDVNRYLTTRSIPSNTRPVNLPVRNVSETVMAIIEGIPFNSNLKIEGYHKSGYAPTYLAQYIIN